TAYHETRFALFLCNVTAPADSYTLSLHDALPIPRVHGGLAGGLCDAQPVDARPIPERSGFLSCRPGAISRAEPDRCAGVAVQARSEEHTSELQSRENLVCRLLLEKKKKKKERTTK